MKRWPNVPHEHWAQAQAMRYQPTLAEHTLWRALRHNQLGVRFRRQHPLGPYIVDFYCDDAKLIIEVDGSVHGTDAARQHDHERAEYFERKGLRIRRYWNADVLHDLNSVLKDITGVLASPLNPPTT